MRRKKTLVALLMAAGLTIGVAAPAMAHGGHGGTGCNAGGGNGSETTPDNDCDPGNSGGNNNGGD